MSEAARRVAAPALSYTGAAIGWDGVGLAVRMPGCSRPTLPGRNAGKQVVVTQAVATEEKRIRSDELGQ